MQRFVTWFSANKRDLQTALAALAMVLILVYTFWHTAALLASYVTPAPVGWIAALGIEAAVVALSLRAGAYKKTLAAALIVSAIANIERGARESGLAHDGLTLTSVGSIDWLQAVIGIAATALLSVLVFRLADIVSHDAQPATAQAQEDTHHAIRTLDAIAPDATGGGAAQPEAHADALRLHDTPVSTTHTDTPTIDEVGEWRIVAEGPAAPVHEAVSVPHVVALDATHANGNGHGGAYQCDRCERTFGTANALTAHKRFCKGA